MLLPSVSDAYARALSRFLGSRGLPGDAPVLPAPTAPGPASARVAGLRFGDTLTRASEQLGERTLGVAFGTRVGGAAFGLLGIAAASAGTLLEAIEHLQRFESLTSTLGQMTLRREAGTVTLVWQPHAPVAPAVVEGILAGWVSFGRYLVGDEMAGDEPVPVLGVSFAHARPPSVSAHEALMHCPVRFNADEHSVTIPEGLLALRPRCADDRLNGALKRWLDRCTAAVQAPRHRPTTHRVAALLAHELGTQPLDEQQVAMQLGLSPRTLQRRLAAEGMAFRHLLDAARAQHAIVAVLRGGQPLIDLGPDIGFEEQSSLCRAFRRWTGYAPLALRERLAPIASELRLRESMASH